MQISPSKSQQKSTFKIESKTPKHSKGGEHSEQVKEEDKFFKNYSLLFVYGYNNFSARDARHLERKCLAHGAKIFYIFEINKKDIHEILRQMDYIIMPHHTLSPKSSASTHRDFVRLARLFEISYDDLMHCLQNEGQGITFVDPKWIEDCMEAKALVDYRNCQLLLPVEPCGLMKDEAYQHNLESPAHLQCHLNKAMNPEIDEPTEEDNLDIEANRRLRKQERKQQQYDDKHYHSQKHKRQDFDIEDLDEELKKEHLELKDQKDKENNNQSNQEQKLMSLGMSTEGGTPLKQTRESITQSLSTSKKRPRPDVDEKIDKLGFGRIDKLFFPATNAPSFYDPMDAKSKQFGQQKRLPLNDVIINQLQLKLIHSQKERDQEQKAQEFQKALDYFQNLKSPVMDMLDLEDIPQFNKEIMNLLKDLTFSGGDYIEDKLLDYEEHFMALLEETGGDREKMLQKLSVSQKQLLQNYKDFEILISRNEAQQVLEIIKQTCLELIDTQEQKENLKIELCGAYSRGVEKFDLIDILVQLPQIQNTDMFLMNLNEKMFDKGNLAMRLDKFRVSATGAQGGQLAFKIDDQSHAMRVDIHCYPEDEFPYAHLYFTSPYDFNLWIRMKAEQKGYALSDCEMLQILDFEGEKLLMPMKIKVKEEKDIFETLDLQYLEPEKREEFVKQHLNTFMQ
eukprot:403356153